MRKHSQAHKNPDITQGVTRNAYVLRDMIVIETVSNVGRPPNTLKAKKTRGTYRHGFTYEENYERNFMILSGHPLM